MPWSHPDRADTQILAQETENLSQRVRAVKEEEDFSDALFSGEFLLRDLPHDFQATWHARRSIMHCDVAELALQSSGAAFQQRIVSAPIKHQIRTGRLDASGLLPASVSLLPYYHRDSLIARNLHIFVFSDCACFAYRTIDTSSACIPSPSTKMDDRETWYFNKTIGILHPLSESTAYPDFPHVLVLQAKPAVKAPTSQPALLHSMSSQNTSVVSLIPPSAKDHQQLLQLENALKTSILSQFDESSTSQSRPIATSLNRLYRTSEFWQERLNEVVPSVPAPPVQTRTAYFL